MLDWWAFYGPSIASLDAKALQSANAVKSQPVEKPEESADK